MPVYYPVLQMSENSTENFSSGDPGDPSRGAVIFRQRCATCHTYVAVSIQRYTVLANVLAPVKSMYLLFLNLESCTLNFFLYCQHILPLTL